MKSQFEKEGELKARGSIGGGMTALPSQPEYENGYRKHAFLACLRDPAYFNHIRQFSYENSFEITSHP
jgi:hypothetical protein